jgi:hypothetical protein
MDPAYVSDRGDILIACASCGTWHRVTPLSPGDPPLPGYQIRWGKPCYTRASVRTRGWEKGWGVVGYTGGAGAGELLMSPQYAMDMVRSD